MPDVLSAYADCVASLHEAALSPERWPEALQASMHLFGASGILLTDIDTERGSPRSIQTAGHEPALLAAYAGHYQSIDPTIAVGMAGANGTVYHLREHFWESQMSRMEYFQDFLFAFGVSDVMAMPIDYAPNARLFVSLQRRTGEPSFDSTCHPLLTRFARQVNIAKQTEARLRASSDSNKTLASGLDAFTAAMFIVDATTQVRHQNRAADMLLRTRKGVECHLGHLRLTSSAANAQLLHAVRAASQLDGQAATFTVAAKAGTLQVLATPLHPAHEVITSWQEPLVLLIVSDPHGVAVTAAQTMRRLYGLTEAEGRLVGELADGKTLREIADLRAVGEATLRTQLLAVFNKTAMHRQVDLVRLASSLASVAADTNEGISR